MNDVHLSGPVFDGRAARAAAAFAIDASRTIATEGRADVEEALSSSLKHPTGHYQSGIRVDRLGSDFRVNDSGIVYGNWLEGTGSRNRTTRFKGYASFRKARERLSGKAGVLAERVLIRYLREMG